jgi:hypothetical protein
VYSTHLVVRARRDEVPTPILVLVVILGGVVVIL